ncbi:MAG: hypothetical protein ACK56I_06450 [bacterium]
MRQPVSLIRARGSGGGVCVSRGSGRGARSGPTGRRTASPSPPSAGHPGPASARGTP